VEARTVQRASVAFPFDHEPFTVLCRGLFAARLRMLVSASSAVSSASGNVCRYRAVVAMSA
jgi:hypothetical protein